MRNYLCLLALVPGIAFAASADQYSACTQLAASNPAAGLQTAESWLKQGNLPSARHCRALSLYGLGRYSEAAVDLEKLSEDFLPAQTALKLNVLEQAATARDMAGEMNASIQNFNRAAQLAASGSSSSELTRLLYKKAAMLRKHRQYLAAIQPLDQLLAKEPAHVEALVLRAELLKILNSERLAKKDAEKALVFSPSNAKAKEISNKPR